MRHSLPPGPAGFPLGLRLAKRLRDEPLAFATQMARDYGDLACFRLCPYRACVVSHPTLVRTVLVTKAKSFRKLPRVMRILGQLDGQGLVISEGDAWLNQRRLLQPAFNNARLQQYEQVVTTATQGMLTGWSDGTVLDVVDAMMRLVLDVLLKALFATELAPGQLATVCEAVGLLSERLLREMGQPFVLPDWLPFPGKRPKREAIRLLDSLLREIVLQRRPSGAENTELLTLLLSGGCARAEEEARDEAMTLLHAGHETTAAGLAWIWYLLAKHPAVQQKIVEEAETVLGGRAPTTGDISRLNYLGMVIKEALRLYTPTWIMFPRESVHDVRIGGYVLPRGTWIFIFPYALHRDPRWFERPEEFDPERFSPERIKHIPPCAYIPFGVGQHQCIGSKFVLMAMTLIVETVLQRFRVELAVGQGVPEPEPFLALHPKGGIRLCLHARQI